jgi:hypothetical protein
MPLPGMKATHLQASDLPALARLATDATLGVTDLVEAVHAGIARPWGRSAASHAARTRGITGLVYAGIRSLTRGIGGGTVAALERLAPPVDPVEPTPARLTALAALNAVFGDRLAASGNALALPMRLHRDDGCPLPLESPVPIAATSQATSRVLILVHGLGLHDGHWRHAGHDYGALLARTQGYTPLYLRYNTGLHVAANGRALAELLEALQSQWPLPIESLAIIAHSMGGLVARSACHHAGHVGHAWRPRLRSLVCLGTPHHGAPLERAGLGAQRLLAALPFAGPFASLGRLRSAGITDLRHGNLLHDDAGDGDRFADAVDRRTPVPLPRGVRCHAIAASIGGRSDGLAARLLGDGLVPLDSALGRHPQRARRLAFPRSRQWVAEGIGHFDLLGDAAVAQRLQRWLAV